jgi:hypothetical protein
MPEDRRHRKPQTRSKYDAPCLTSACSSAYGHQQAIKRAQPSPPRHTLKALEGRAVGGGHRQTRATLKGGGTGCRDDKPEEPLTAMFRMRRDVEKQCDTLHTPRGMEGKITEGLGSDDFVPDHRQR